MSIKAMIAELFTFPNMSYTCEEDADGDVVVTYNNLIVKVQARGGSAYYMQIKINNIRVLTTVGNMDYVKQILDNMLDSCDMIEA